MGVIEIGLNLPNGYFIGKIWGGKNTYKKSSHQILEYLIFKQAHIPWFMTHFHMGSNKLRPQLTSEDMGTMGRLERIGRQQGYEQQKKQILLYDVSW